MQSDAFNSHVSGVRYAIRAFQSNAIEAITAAGTHSGKEVRLL